MNNGYGSARTSRTQDFALYDQLPRKLRDACKYAVANWSTRWVNREFRDLTNFMELPPAHAIRITIGNMQHTEPEDTYRAYGPDHPEADNHGRKLKPAKFANWGRRS